MEAWRRELYHHGIKGQRWGVRRGPPYPLGEAKTRKNTPKSSGKPAGRVDNRVEKSYALSKNFSKALKVGTVATLTGLAVYGAYRSGYLSKASKIGRQAVKEAMGKVGSLPTGNFGDFTPPSGSSPSRTAPKSRHAPVIRDPKTGFKLINEPLSESLKNANPLKGTKEGSGNCTYSAIAGFLRTQGYDVVAKGTKGEGRNFGTLLENVFKGVQLREGQGGAIPRSPDDAARMLKKRFGDNAAGVIMLTWNAKGDPSHAFNWVIKDGAVRFLDFQNKNDDSVCRNYWNLANHDGSFLFARLDADKDGNKLEINLDTVRQYVTER